MTDSPDIIVRGLSKSFGRKRVLEDVSFAVGRGQTFASLGRNGADKTTTLRLLLGLLPCDAGHMQALGLDPGTGSNASKSAAASVTWPESEQRISYHKATISIIDDRIVAKTLTAGSLCRSGNRPRAPEPEQVKHRNRFIT